MVKPHLFIVFSLSMLVCAQLPSESHAYNRTSGQNRLDVG